MTKAFWGSFFLRCALRAFGTRLVTICCPKTFSFRLSSNLIGNSVRRATSNHFEVKSKQENILGDVGFDPRGLATLLELAEDSLCKIYYVYINKRKMCPTEGVGYTSWAI